MEYGNMLAVVGSPGSGKTTISIKTAQEIAKHHKNVIVVFADPFVPVLPFVLPMDEEQKIGRTADTADTDTEPDLKILCHDTG